MSRLIALISGLLLFIGIANAELASPTAALAVVVEQRVDASGNTVTQARVGTLGFYETGYGLGPDAREIPAADLPSLMPTLTVSAPFTRAAVLQAANTWVAENAKSMGDRLAAYLNEYGLPSLWYTYSRPFTVPVAGGTSTQQLTWALFLDAKGRVSYGEPRLEVSDESAVRVLHVTYAAHGLAPGVPESARQAGAGRLLYQVTSSTMDPIGALVQAPVPLGAFDHKVESGSMESGEVLRCLLKSRQSGCVDHGVDVERLLEETGAVFAVVDYTYSPEPNYQPVPASYCTGGSGNCYAVLPQYYYTLREIEYTTCNDTATFRTHGDYRFGITAVTDRYVVDSTLSPRLLQRNERALDTAKVVINDSKSMPYTEALTLQPATLPVVINPYDHTSIVDVNQLIGSVSQIVPIKTIGTYECPPMSVTVSPSTHNVKTTGTFTATVSGGGAPYTYQWSVIRDNAGGTITIANPTSRQTTITRTGPTLGPAGGVVGLVKVTVTDRRGTQQEATVQLIIDPDPPPLELIFDQTKVQYYSPLHGTVAVYGECRSRNDTCTAVTSAAPVLVRGGTGTVTVSWRELTPDDAIVTAGNSPTTSFSRSGTHGVRDVLWRVSASDDFVTKHLDLAVRTVHIQEPSVILTGRTLRTIHFKQASIVIRKDGSFYAYGEEGIHGDWLKPKDFAEEFEVFAVGHNLGGDGIADPQSPLNTWLPLGGPGEYKWFTNRAAAKGPGSWAGWVELTFRRKTTGEVWGPFRFDLISEGDCIWNGYACGQLLP